MLFAIAIFTNYDSVQRALR